MEQEVKDTVSSVVAETALALKDAATEYGPMAVDLTLAAYRLEAVQQLLEGLIGLVFLLLLISVYRRFWHTAKILFEEDYIFPRGMAAIPTVFIGILLLDTVSNKLFDLTAWVAVFGYPELRIVTKALEAAGLM